MPRTSRLLAVLLLLSVPTGSRAGARLEAGACARVAQSAPRLAASRAHDGSLALSDGRRLVPAGVILPSSLNPDADLVARSAAAVAQVLDGRFLQLDAPKTDRHGRLVGTALLSEAVAESEGTPLALALLEAGAGYADPSGAPACADQLRAAEDHARRNKRGIFATDGAILAAGDTVATGMRAGLFVLAEGRVKAAGSTARTVYLNFGPRWRDDFTIILAAKDFATILGDDQNVALLRGARVRVRGVVREEGGPAIFVRRAGEISILTDPQAAVPGKGVDE